MQFNRPLIQLPIAFSAETLAAEVRALPAAAWTPHPTGFVGNEAVRLVSPGGQPTDAIQGQMGPTEHLRACRYIRQTMEALGGVWGRSRLMGLAPGAEVPAHVDSHYYWRTHLRIHIPIITNPGVLFTCGGETVHMAAGECWVFDSFQRHDVQNKGAERRIHLVLDTVMTGPLWDLVEAAEGSPARQPREMLAPETCSGDGVRFELANMPKVMGPWEMRTHIAYLAGHARPDRRLGAILHRLDRFASAWGAVWAQFANTDDGLPSYRALVAEAKRELDTLGGHDILLTNGVEFYYALDQLVFVYAVRPGQMQPAQGGAAAAQQRLAS